MTPVRAVRQIGLRQRVGVSPTNPTSDRHDAMEYRGARARGQYSEEPQRTLVSCKHYWVILEDYQIMFLAYCVSLQGYGYPSQYKLCPYVGILNTLVVFNV